MKVEHRKVAGRTIAVDKTSGQPIMLGIAARTSRSAPGRVKVALFVPLSETKGVAMPVSNGRGTASEFRLEMN